ncbi:MAG: hypothetical protein KC731_27360 [Myxococcales bacterium]|nr:hypothetical protein [Myxococcales bacterium]
MLVAFGLVLGGLTSGCVENNTTIFIQTNKYADPEEACIVTPDPENTFIPNSFLDVSLRDTYVANLLVGNQGVSSADADRLRTETNRVTLYQAEVEVFDPRSGSTLSSFSEPISGFVDIGNGNAPGWGIARVNLIHASDLNGYLGPTVARVKVFGETLGGNDVETGIWDYPIEVCTDCTPCYDPPTPDDCNVEAHATCFVGQDSGADCRCLPGANGGNRSVSCGTTFIGCF